MTPLPAALGGGELVAWRLDRAEFAPGWDSGEGAYRQGGRWNNRGMRAVYCALDPATAILEVAVHKGFVVLDTQPHIMTSLVIDAPQEVHIVRPDDVPNPNWLRPGIPSAGQKAFGDALLTRHKLIVIPSAVSSLSWNLVFVAERAKDSYRLLAQEKFAFDTRLDPLSG